jgi:hypothetical protein
LPDSISSAAGTLTGLSWAASSTATGATGATYTYGFTIASTATLTAVTLSVRRAPGAPRPSAP